MLLKDIYIWSLDLLNFVCIMFDVETALENAELVIQEGLEFQIFFAPSQIRKFYSGKYSGIFTKTKLSSMLWTGVYLLGPVKLSREIFTNSTLSIQTKENGVRLTIIDTRTTSLTLL